MASYPQACFGQSVVAQFCNVSTLKADATGWIASLRLAWQQSKFQVSLGNVVSSCPKPKTANNVSWCLFYISQYGASLFWFVFAVVENVHSEVFPVVCPNFLPTRGGQEKLEQGHSWSTGRFRSRLCVVLASKGLSDKAKLASLAPGSSR